MGAKGEETRQAIVRRAADLFNTRGFAGTSISDVMAATDLRKGGIYNHFPDKESIAVAAFEENWRRMRDRFLDASTGHGIPAIEGLHRAIEAQRPLAGDDLIAGGCPILRGATDGAGDAIRPAVMSASATWQGALAQLVEGCAAEGSLAADIDVEQLVTTIIACTEGGVLLSRLHADPIHIDRALAHLHDHLAELSARARA